MFINYSNPSSNAESICDNSCPILINSCGYYRLKKQADLLPTRPHGRLDYQIIYIASGHGVFYFDDMDELAGKRRKLAQTKAPEAMMTLLDTAISSGLEADYVLFDSWFSNPVQITAIHSKGMDVIAMVKKNSRIKYSYCGEQLNIKEIYSRNKKRRGKSKYLLSVDVTVGKINPIPAKIVCVKNRANRQDWLAFICTDTTLSEEIIRIYGNRWQIMPISA